MSWLVGALTAALPVVTGSFVGVREVRAADASIDYGTVLELQSEARRNRRAARARLLATDDRSWLPGLVDLMFYVPRERREELLDVLRSLSGEDRGERYYDWVEWIGSQEDLEPHLGYEEFKSSLLQRIDPDYGRVIYPGVTLRIRLEEIVWGGVRIGGIPVLVEPESGRASEQSYLEPEELVFGVSLNGEQRAYPLRIMDWHEMLEDEVGGEPVVLSYCTLCRSGILYSRRDSAGAVHRFGTSGLLYRSNKLMIDGETLSLWSNLTGEAVVGRLAGAGASLRNLPLTLTTWSEWRRLHPETRVVSLEPLETRYRFDYRPGAADEARSGVSFPVWQRDRRLDPRTEVFTLRIGGSAKAWEVEAMVRVGVLNDSLAGKPLVLIADRTSGAIRTYERGEQQFHRSAAGRLLDQTGREWTMTEEALIATDRPPLQRLAGHIAFWFGWVGFYPGTELWAD